MIFGMTARRWRLPCCFPVCMCEEVLVWPSAASITRLEQTFDWVLWIEEAER